MTRTSLNHAIAFFLVLLLLPAALGQRRDRPKPAPATLACGMGVAWRADLATALEDARQAARPVFWYIPTVGGSRMDRKREIDLAMMAGPFADQDVEAILNLKFIPLKKPATGAPQKRYGLEHLDFIEPGFLVLAPDGKELLRVGKISTLSSEWFAWQLRQILAAHPHLAAPSDELVAARKAKDTAAIAAALLREGDAEAAVSVLETLAEDAPAATRLTLVRALRRARRLPEARQALDVFGTDPRQWGPGVLAERLRLDLAAARMADAADAFERALDAGGDPDPESRFLYGVALRLTQRQDAARATWAALAQSHPDDRFGHKASAESQRVGPVSRALERYDALPPDAFLANPDGTRVPRTRKDIPFLAERSVRLLLMNQRGDGSWDDSFYDFGGTASLPNVYVAGTALGALSLLTWRTVAPADVDAAVDRACRYLLDETNLAHDDENEIVWAHAYRLLFFRRYLEAEGPRAAAVRTKAKDIVRELIRSQLDSGAWRHEYPNPMATATVIHALHSIGTSGVPTGQATVTQAGQALARCRADDGTFSYGMSREPGAAIQASAGRMPLCELGLLLSDLSSQPRLRAALEASFTHHQHLESVRKIDDHAGPYANGGFFFWYDMLARQQAIDAVTDVEARTAFRDRLLDLTLQIPEIDGGFIDSHELGKTYGTAMALLVLAGTSGNP